MARAEKKAKTRKLLKIVIIAVVVLLLTGIVYQIGKNAVYTITRWNRGIEPVKWGCLQEKVTARAVVINNEMPLMAQFEGRFENTVKDKEKVSKGEKLGSFVAINQQAVLTAPIAGILVLKTDGLEGMFDNLKIGEVGQEVFNYTPKPIPDNNGQIYPGRAVCKVVDNLTPTRLLVKIPETQISRTIKLKQAVEVVYGKKSVGTAYIEEKKQESGSTIMILEFNDFREELMEERYCDLGLVFDSCYGYLVPQKALLEKGSEKGIYCTKEEDLIYKPVKVMAVKDGRAVVEGLDANDMIVTNPPKI